MPKPYLIHIDESARTHGIPNYLVKYYPDFFQLSKNQVRYDISFELWDVHKTKFKPKHKTLFLHHHDRHFHHEKSLHLRSGEYVDKRCRCFVNNGNPTYAFTSHDVPFGIKIPLSFQNHRLIDQPDNYFHDFSNTIEYFGGKIFWSGNPTTHNTRQNIVNTIKHNYQSSNITINDASHITKNIYQKGIEANHYNDFINVLKNQDVFLVIRGDLPTTFTFMDAIAHNVIPCFTQCVRYTQLNWPRLGFLPEETYFQISQATLFDDMDFMIEALKNRSKILQMKQNINRFYETYIKTDRLYLNKKHDKMYTGWMDFIAAKVIEHIENNYRCIESTLFSKYISQIKNII